MDSQEKEGFQWYNAERFWEDFTEVKRRPLNSLLVGQFNRYLARVRAGEFGPGERRITRLFLEERSESLTQAIPDGDFIEAAKKDIQWLNPFFNDFMSGLKDEQRRKQEIPLVSELLLCGTSGPELKSVYRGLLGMHVNQTEIKEYYTVLYEVWGLMVAKGFAIDPNDPRI